MHYFRKFSLTSSQANKAFVASICKYKNNRSWKTVAEILYGPTWQEILVPNIVEEKDPAEQSDPVEIQSLADFISSYNLPNEDDREFIFYQSALDKLEEFVVSLVVEDRVLDDDENSSDGRVLSEEEAGEALARGGSWLASDKQQGKLILNSFNPHNLEMKGITNAMLKEWLQRPNAYREVMFYTSESLKTMMQRKKLAFATGRMTMTRMIEALSGTNLDDLHGHNSDADAGATSIVITSAEAAKRAILAKSFCHIKKVQSVSIVPLATNSRFPL